MSSLNCSTFLDISVLKIYFPEIFFGQFSIASGDPIWREYVEWTLSTVCVVTHNNAWKYYRCRLFWLNLQKNCTNLWWYKFPSAKIIFFPDKLIEAAKCQKRCGIKIYYQKCEQPLLKLIKFMHYFVKCTYTLCLILCFRDYIPMF